MSLCFFCFSPLTTPCVSTGHRWDSRWSEAAVQNRLGNLPEDHTQDGGWPRRLHWPEPVAEHPHRRAQLRQTHQHALLRLETGKWSLEMKDDGLAALNPTFCETPLALATGSEDGDVLPEDEARRQPHPVHPEQGEAEGWVRQGRGGGDQRAQHCCHGVFSGEPGQLWHVRLVDFAVKLNLCKRTPQQS